MINLEATPHELFSYPLLTPPPLGPKIIPKLYILKHPLACVLPSVWQTKFYTHIKQQAKLELG
jgi:hypothetical protein